MIKVGDKVRLTGEDWETSYDELFHGDIVAITKIDNEGIWTEDVGSVGRYGALYSASNPEGSGDYSCELVSGSSEESTRNRAKSFAIVDEATISDEMYEAVRNATRINGVDLSPESKQVNFELNVRRITDQIADLLIAKNKQYSNSALDPIRVFSKADRMEQLRVRADDKLSRIRNGDTSEDAVLDLCGYLILMKIAGESE